jgi:hypothetical protein
MQLPERNMCGEKGSRLHYHPYKKLKSCISGKITFFNLLGSLIVQQSCPLTSKLEREARSALQPGTY